jgi:hypothetical protein
MWTPVEAVWPRQRAGLQEHPVEERRIGEVRRNAALVVRQSGKISVAATLVREKQTQPVGPCQFKRANARHFPHDRQWHIFMTIDDYHKTG